MGVGALEHAQTVTITLVSRTADNRLGIDLSPDKGSLDWERRAHGPIAHNLRQS
jgi:hypothetical protein